MFTSLSLLLCKNTPLGSVLDTAAVESAVYNYSELFLCYWNPSFDLCHRWRTVHFSQLELWFCLCFCNSPAVCCAFMHSIWDLALSCQLIPVIFPKALSSCHLALGSSPCCEFPKASGKSYLSPTKSCLPFEAALRLHDWWTLLAGLSSMELPCRGMGLEFVLPLSVFSVFNFTVFFKVGRDQLGYSCSSVQCILLLKKYVFINTAHIKWGWFLLFSAKGSNNKEVTRENWEGFWNTWVVQSWLLSTCSLEV